MGTRSKLLRLLVTTVTMVGLLIPATAERAIAQAPPTGASSLSVSPPTVEVDAQPGEVLKRTVTIDNSSEVSRTLNVVVQNFRATGEGGEADLTEENGPNALASWIKVSPSKATLEPRGTQDFEVQITVPKTPSPGGHFGALVFEPGVAPGDANVKVVSRITSLILLRIPGDATEKASIAGFTASVASAKPAEDGTIPSTSFFQKGPVRYSVRVRGEGNVQVKPEIFIEVRNLFGSKIATLKPESRNVLPDSIRRFDADWDQKQFLGPYKAVATVKYGNGVVVTSETSFWGAPLKTLGVATLGLLATFLLLWLPRKRLKKAFKALSSAD